MTYMIKHGVQYKTQIHTSPSSVSLSSSSVIVVLVIVITIHHHCHPSFAHGPSYVIFVVDCCSFCYTTSLLYSTLIHALVYNKLCSFQWWKGRSKTFPERSRCHPKICLHINCVDFLCNMIVKKWRENCEKVTIKKWLELCRKCLLSCVEANHG